MMKKTVSFVYMASSVMADESHQSSFNDSLNLNLGNNEHLSVPSNNSNDFEDLVHRQQSDRPYPDTPPMQLNNDNNESLILKNLSRQDSRTQNPDRDLQYIVPRTQPYMRSSSLPISSMVPGSYTPNLNNPVPSYTAPTPAYATPVQGYGTLMPSYPTATPTYATPLPARTQMPVPYSAAPNAVPVGVNMNYVPSPSPTITTTTIPASRLFQRNSTYGSSGTQTTASGAVLFQRTGNTNDNNTVQTFNRAGQNPVATPRAPPNTPVSPSNPLNDFILYGSSQPSSDKTSLVQAIESLRRALILQQDQINSLRSGGAASTGTLASPPLNTVTAPKLTAISDIIADADSATLQNLLKKLISVSNGAAATNIVSPPTSLVATPTPTPAPSTVVTPPSSVVTPPTNNDLFGNLDANSAATLLRILTAQLGGSAEYATNAPPIQFVDNSSLSPPTAVNFNIPPDQPSGPLIAPDGFVIVEEPTSVTTRRQNAQPTRSRGLELIPVDEGDADSVEATEDEGDADDEQDGITSDAVVPAGEAEEDAEVVEEEQEVQTGTTESDDGVDSLMDDDDVVRDLLSEENSDIIY